MTKRPFSMNYKTYDDSQGRGTPREWRAAFHATMGFDEARHIVGDSSPEGILGVRIGATWAQIKAAFRAKALDCHPDRCALHGLSIEVATERFKLLIAAFTVLEARHSRTV